MLLMAPRKNKRHTTTLYSSHNNLIYKWDNISSPSKILLCPPVFFSFFFHSFILLVVCFWIWSSSVLNFQRSTSKLNHSPDNLNFRHISATKLGNILHKLKLFHSDKQPLAGNFLSFVRWQYFKMLFMYWVRYAFSWCGGMVRDHLVFISNFSKYRNNLGNFRVPHPSVMLTPIYCF